MTSNSEMAYTFFHELKKYNTTNYKALQSTDLDAMTSTQLLTSHPETMKAFSSVITRFFIFREKHPELSDIDVRILYFQLKLDMIARFFSQFPNSDIDDLNAFQRELKFYDKEDPDVIYSA